MKEYAIGFLVGIIAMLVYRSGSGASLENSQQAPKSTDCACDQPVPYRCVYTTDQFEDEPTPAETMAADTELCYGYSVTPKGAPRS